MDNRSEKHESWRISEPTRQREKETRNMARRTSQAALLTWNSFQQQIRVIEGKQIIKDKMTHLGLDNDDVLD